MNFNKSNTVEQMILRPFQSGAEATALQTLTRLPGGLKFREASGVRRVHRRCRAHDTPKNERDAPPAQKRSRVGDFQDFGADVGGLVCAERLGFWTYGAGAGERRMPGGAA